MPLGSRSRTFGCSAPRQCETLELAQLCDRLGYHRYWVAEHHSSQALAGSTPEVLITRLASLTERFDLLSNHAARLRLGQSTARGESHKSKRYYTLSL